MADIMQQIEAYEDHILNSIGTFVKTVLGLPVYLKDKPFIAPEKPYVTLRVITSDNSGGWGQRSKLENDMFSYFTDNNYTIEIMVYRGRPMAAMSYLISAFNSLDELKYQTMYSKGVSYLSSSDASQANTILDGDKTQLRARAIFTFNTRMLLEDIPTTPIEQVRYSIHSYNGTYADPDPLEYNDHTFVYVT